MSKSNISELNFSMIPPSIIMENNHNNRSIVNKVTKIQKLSFINEVDTWFISPNGVNPKLIYVTSNQKADTSNEQKQGRHTNSRKEQNIIAW